MKRLLVALIRRYQILSRAYSVPQILFPGLSGCRSWPSCSDYSIHAIERDGVLRGGIKSIARVLRCNPFISPTHTI